MSTAATSANQSVARALRILRTLADAQDGLGVRELARSIKVSPSIAQRLLSTLADYGFAEQEPSRRYRVGVQAYAVGNAYLSAHALVRAGLAELRELAETHQLNGYLGVLRGREVVYLIALQSSGPIAIKSSPGARTHLHTTALGKAMLAQMTDEEAARLLGPQPYARLTPRSRTRLVPLLAELALARQNGYAVSDEENLVGVYAVGAAVRDAEGATVAAISGALPRHEVNRSSMPRLCKLVRDAADRISARLGAPGR
jgi:DNA-binding IclR family transcriptional regulator